jgi:hypothetical protein
MQCCTSKYKLRQTIEPPFKEKPMSLLQQKATEMFLEQFLLHPTVTEVNNQYRWRQEDHPRVSSDSKYDPYKMICEYYSPLVEEYFTRTGSPINAEVAQEFVHLAEVFARQKYGHCEQYDNPAICAQHGRLKALILNPTFLADACAVEVMKALKDLTYCEPWSFQMWVDYDFNGNRYLLKPGFGEEQIAGLHRLILCDELWIGKSQGMHRVFFSSVAEVLQLLVRDYGLHVQTLQARLDLLERNCEHGEHAEILYHTVYTFESDEDKAALQKVIQDRPSSKIAEEAREILSGRYANTAWAI